MCQKSNKRIQCRIISLKISFAYNRVYHTVYKILNFICPKSDRSHIEERAVKFLWIPTHCGLKGNITACRISATNRLGNRPNFGPMGDLAGWFCIRMWGNGEGISAHISKGTWTFHRYISNISYQSRWTWFGYMACPKGWINSVTHSRTGNIRKHEHLSCMGWKAIPGCRCGEVVCSLKHMIYECLILEENWLNSLSGGSLKTS